MRFSYSGTLDGRPAEGEVADGQITGNPFVRIRAEALVEGRAHVGWGPVTGEASLTDPNLAQATVAAVLDEGSAAFEGDGPPVSEGDGRFVIEGIGLPPMGDGNGTVLSPARALRAFMEATVADDGPATRRLRALRELREELDILSAEVDRALSLIESEDDSLPAHLRRDLIQLRENADLREELLARRLYTADALDALGLVSHEVIDRCIENDVLEEAIGRFGDAFTHATGAAFERLHPRGRGGKFIDKPGGAGIEDLSGALLPKPTPKRRPGPRPRTPLRRARPRAVYREVTKQKKGAAGGGPRFTRYEAITADERVGRTDRGSTVKKVLRDANGNEYPVYETFDVTRAEVLDAVNAGIDHPALSFKARSELRERKHGKGNAPGVRVTRAEAKERGLEDEAEGMTYEDVRAGEYEKRREKLEKRVGKEVERGTKADAISGVAEWNDAERTSQGRLLRYAREAATAPTTAEMHAQLDDEGNYVTDDDGNTVFDADRASLHEAIAELFLRKRRREPTGKTDSEGNPEYRYVLCADCGYMEGQEQPEVLFSGGGYSSGKGGVVDRLIEQMDGENTLVLDPDQIKALLPEFSETLEGDPEANLRTFEEAWSIAQVIQRRAQEMKLNVVVDGISDGHADEMLARVDQFRGAGYENPRVVYVDIPTEEALKRAAIRARKAKKPSDRRHIPEPIMRAVHRDVAATIPGVIDGAAERGLSVEVWDNDQGQAADGSFNPPRRFVNFDPSAEGGEEFIEDRRLWDRLQVKAEETIPGVQGELPPLPERVQALVDQARELGIDKWPPAKDAAAQKIIPADAFDTQDLYAAEREGTVFYDPQRIAEVHEPIIERMLEGYESQESPRILYATGGMASGKGTVLAEMEKQGQVPEGAITLNPDDVKQMLPEWEQFSGNPYAGTATHRESAAIMRKVWDRAKERNLNIVVDSSAGGWPSGWLREELEEQRRAGYDAEVIMVDIPIGMAIERAMGRAVSEGRFVPISRLQSNHATVSSRLQELIDLDWLPLRLFTNRESKFDLEQAVMAERGPDGKLAVKRPAEYNDWVAKAELEPQAPAR